MLIKAIATLAVSLLPVMSFAQARLDLSKIPTNTQTKWKTQNGGHTTTYHGKSGRFWLTETTGTGRSPFTVLRHTNRRGQTKSLKADNGLFIRFKPHDCTGKIGTCKYTEHWGDGTVHKWLKKTTWDGEKYTTKQYYQDRQENALYREETKTIDANGLLMFSEYKIFKDGKVTKSGWQKRLPN